MLTNAIAKLIIIGCFIVCSLTSSNAQWVGDTESEAHAHKGIDYVYNLSFDSARTEFQQIVKKNPQHPAGYFFLAMVDWWKIVTDLDNTSYDDHFLSQLDRVIDLCDQRLDKDEHDAAALFFKGGALGFRGRLHGNRGDWVKAANDGRTALPIVQDAYKLAPQNSDILLGIGIYNYFAEVVPEQYPFVKPFMIFFPKGNRQKGIAQLRLASEKAVYANIEASYFLMQLLQNFEKRSDEALTLATKLHAKYPNNVIFHKYVGRCSASLSNWSVMRKIYTEVLDRVVLKKIGYDNIVEREAHYYLGLDEMNSQHLDAALTHFYHADELSRTIERKEQTGFMVMTNLKIGQIYDMQKKRDLAKTQYEKVLKFDDFQDAHKQAEQYLKTPYGKP
jgi:tetratricopeptide (TPR) repeat protein